MRIHAQRVKPAMGKNLQGKKEKKVYFLKKV